jgi:type IV pilus assembly protein PilA
VPCGWLHEHRAAHIIEKKANKEILMRIQDRLNKLRNKRGFTLVELMIVVAIIGVLAALAIYGVRKYLTNAKTAEARMGLGRLAKDAQVAYEKEAMAGGFIALTNSRTIAHALCPDVTQSVPDVIGDVSNQKYQSSPDEWNANGWACLKFSMQDPQYFMYNYDANGSAAANDDFTATAQGDLDGDGNPSTFAMTGEIQTSASGELVLTLAPTITETAAEE